jgi:hypothetical protein
MPPHTASFCYDVGVIPTSISPASETIMVGTFEKQGIHFQYPENWELTEDTSTPESLTITLQSPGSAFWLLRILDLDNSPERLVAEVLNSMRQEYDELEATMVQQRLHEVDTVGYDMQFYCLDLLVNSHVRSFVVDERAYLMMYQAEDREFDEMLPVFQAVITSMMRDSF